jgi:hypothetical protein
LFLSKSFNAFQSASSPSKVVIDDKSPLLGFASAFMNSAGLLIGSSGTVSCEQKVNHLMIVTFIFETHVDLFEQMAPLLQCSVSGSMKPRPILMQHCAVAAKWPSYAAEVMSQEEEAVFAS